MYQRWYGEAESWCSTTLLDYDLTCAALQNPSLTSIVKRGKQGGGGDCGFSMLCGPETFDD